MKTTLITFLSGLVILTTNAYGQKGPARYFGEPVLTDSVSTLFIPTRYNEEFLSSNKIAFWGDYFANIIIYNFKTDTYKKLFDNDTFIESFRGNAYNYQAREYEKIKNITSNWVLLLVKTMDTNNSGRIDEKDPSVLFAISLDGKSIKQLTNENENVFSFENFDKQGFVLIKIQRDSNNDKSFKSEDKDFYFRKVSLADLSLGEKVEIK